MLIESTQDLDLIVFAGNIGPERLKRALVANDDRFYLQRSSNPDANYHILWCSLPTHPRARRPRRCKVDILTPGSLNIPYIPRGRIVHLNDLPVMPLMPLLLMKLQGWSDHRDSSRPDFQDKVPVDVEDILDLLQIACDKPYCRLSRSTWLPQTFLDLAQSRIEEFVDEESGESAGYWQTLEFDVWASQMRYEHQCCSFSSLTVLDLTLVYMPVVSTEPRYCSSGERRREEELWMYY